MKKKDEGFEAFKGKCIWCILLAVVIYAAVFALAGTIRERCLQQYCALTVERVMLR